MARASTRRRVHRAPHTQLTKRLSEIRSALLPRSGIGVVGPWLVIAPAGNPIMRLDLRLIDSIGVMPDRRRTRRPNVIITRADVSVALQVEDGLAAARRVVRDAAPWTRSSTRLPRRDDPQRDARLVVVSSTLVARRNDPLAGRELALARDVTMIGRTSENDLVLPVSSVSRRHAKITREARGRYLITDLQSTNGVSINGTAYGRVELRQGDWIDLGRVRLRFERNANPAWATRARPDRRQFLVVGNDPVVRSGEYLVVGQVAFRVSQVAAYAVRGANLPLTGGRLLQAAMALLVLAHESTRAAPD